MIINPTQVRVIEFRRQDALAVAASARLITAATEPSRSTTPRTVGRIRAGLHQAVASLVTLAAIG